MRTCCAHTVFALPLVTVAIVAAAAGCRSALVVAPRDENTQTVVTVEQRPTTNPSEKGLVVREKR